MRPEAAHRFRSGPPLSKMSCLSEEELETKTEAKVVVTDDRRAAAAVR